MLITSQALMHMAAKADLDSDDIRALVKMAEDLDKHPRPQLVAHLKRADAVARLWLVSDGHYMLHLSYTRTAPDDVGIDDVSLTDFIERNTVPATHVPARGLHWSAARERSVRGLTVVDVCCVFYAGEP